MACSSPRGTAANAPMPKAAAPLPALAALLRTVASVFWAACALVGLRAGIVPVAVGRKSPPARWTYRLAPWFIFLPNISHRSAIAPSAASSNHARPLQRNAWTPADRSLSGPRLVRACRSDYRPVWFPVRWSLPGPASLGAATPGRRDPAGSGPPACLPAAPAAGSALVLLAPGTLLDSPFISTRRHALASRPQPRVIP